MKFLDENGRIGGKINLVDLIVIILAVLMVALIGMRMGVLDKADDKVDVTNTTYVVEVLGVRSYSADVIKAGDTLVTQSDGSVLGTISDVRVEQATAAITGIDGIAVEGPVENRYNLYLTVEADCTVSNGRYFVNGTTEVSVNSHIEMKTKYSKFTGGIMEIQ